MKKKFIIPMAAMAALLFTSGGTTQVDAASPETTRNENVYIYQSGHFNNEQLNSFLKKYFQNLQFNLDQIQKQPSPNVPTSTTDKPVTTKPVDVPQQPVQKPVASEPQPTAPASSVSAYEQKVVDLTNQERAKQGLPALKLDTNLSKVARAKSEDMKSKGYFSHTSPTYGSPFDMMKQFGISYRSAGENIAMGQRSPEEVVQAWMNSEGHRANILNGSYTHIGIGYVENGNYWTQMFISK